MDFDVLPPEINSARIYSGPGVGPLMAAASAWDELANELNTTAASYSTVISELTSQEWLGPSSTSMASAAAPYAAWMNTTAAEAEQAAAQARAAATAYEAAFAMTVPPAVIAANRTQLAALVATNILGQNTAAIAANEAQYAEMWAQDIAAMQGYASSSAAASKLTPFTSPPETTNPAGLAGAATVSQTAASTTAAAAVPAQITAIGDGSLISLNLVAAAGTTGTFASMGSSFAGTTEAYRVNRRGETSPTVVGPGIAEEPNLVSAAITSRSVSGTPVSAVSGRAIPIGGLSVPQSWAIPPAIRQVAVALPTTAVPMVMQNGQDSQDIALASLLGTSMAGLALRGTPAATGAAMTRSANKAPAATLVTANKPAAPTAPAATKAAFGSAFTIPAPGIPADVAANLAATLAEIPGATIIVIPHPPPSNN